MLQGIPPMHSSKPQNESIPRSGASIGTGVTSLMVLAVAVKVWSRRNFTEFHNGNDQVLPLDAALLLVFMFFLYRTVGNGGPILPPLWKRSILYISYLIMC